MNLKQIEKFFKIQCWFDGLNMSNKDIHTEAKLIKEDALKDLEPGSQKLIDLYSAYKEIWAEKYGWSLDRCKKEISVIQTKAENPVKILKMTFIFSTGQESYLHMVTDFPFELKASGVFTKAEAFLKFGDLNQVKTKLDKILQKYCGIIPIMSGSFPEVDFPVEDLVKFYQD